MIVRPGNYTATHTGKTGYVSPSPRPKPFPYGIVEEVGSSFYPQYRQFIPRDARKFTDSYYDLRNKPYKFWYDKWGKPHINKWWKYQLDYERTLQGAPWTKKNIRSTHPTQPKFNGKQPWKRHCSSACSWTFRCYCRGKHDKRSNRWRGQNGRNRQWKNRWANDNSFKFQKYRSRYRIL